MMNDFMNSQFGAITVNLSMISMAKILLVFASCKIARRHVPQRVGVNAVCGNEWHCQRVCLAHDTVIYAI